MRKGSGLIHLGSQTLACLSSSARWQILSALVNVVTGAMMPGTALVTIRLQRTVDISTDQDGRRYVRPAIFIAPLAEDFLSRSWRPHGEQHRLKSNVRHNMADQYNELEGRQRIHKDSVERDSD